MPKVVVVTAAETPVNVEIATRVFGSVVRAHLIRHYLQHPGPQAHAAQALGVTRRAASVNTKLLHDAGVLVEEPSPADARLLIYRVDEQRVAELHAALKDFVTDPA
ncbi:helix-turn-helix domain-containing protein [Nocardioides sp. ChNu-99]|uniref:MarR family transcriptional regulator n=1 Tax=Nocardioides sp. ChNu-99 TaxID=2839897 RepID=UPI00240685FA|nr:helix-turn-helix domain-containing protein [Nocardioides sp. ChNu-99]MDF9716461.1 MarR family transcriptional regulator [Nocardioides sp. ChNu-99]